MKKLFFIFFFMSTFSLYSQKILVLDINSKKPIENVQFFTQSRGSVSDQKGLVSVVGFEETDIISIRHISYFEEKIKKNKLLDTLYLMPKNNMLKAINLKESKISQEKSDYIFFKKTNPEMHRVVSTSELLKKIPGITSQENQNGGGSPNFKGMEANRLLLVVDGITLNNGIYRSGHVQSSSLINPFFIESIGVATSSSSSVYGNGSLSGGIVLNTLKPYYKADKGFIHQQYETSSSSSMVNYKMNYDINNIAMVTAFSIKKSDNLKMGLNRVHGYEDWGNEEHIILNGEQKFTEYTQSDFMHKTMFGNYKSKWLLSTFYSTGSKINRFDKLNDKDSEGFAKYKYWYYGPQNRFMQSLHFYTDLGGTIFDSLGVICAYQNLEESRHKQKNSDLYLSNRHERVHVYDLDVSFKKKFSRGFLNYGGGVRKQKVLSSANLELNNTYYYNTTRYPDGGSNIDDLFFYTKIRFNLSDFFFTDIGCRFNVNRLNMLFEDTLTYNFPFDKVKNENQSLVYSLKINYKPNKKTLIYTSAYTGFRNPNVDDIGKVFSKNDNYVVVPNPDLIPEKSQNIEFGFSGNINKILYAQVMVFKTFISNAIIRDFGNINNLDSLLYDGEIMRIQMNKNNEAALIEGVAFFVKYNLLKNITFNVDLSYLKGRDSEKNPLSHIPPLNSKVNLKYYTNDTEVSFYVKHNGTKKANQFDAAGVDNFDEATLEGVPSWTTLNFSISERIDKNILLSVAVENIMDIHYKTFASGMSASGRNIILSLQTNF